MVVVLVRGGRDALAEVVVAPGGQFGLACYASGGAGGLARGALTEVVHGIVIRAHDGVPDFVCVQVEDVAVGLPDVGDGVSRPSATLRGGFA